MRKIDFAPPYIDDDVIAEVVGVLKSGWITTGPKVQELEQLTAEMFGLERTVCTNSWTSAAALFYKWLGLGPGDEVIIPAYTYAATALSAIHKGAKPVIVDVLDDFTIDPEKIKQAITPNTKAVLGVDIGGWPCDYAAIRSILESDEVKKSFHAGNEQQAKLGRPLLIADAAHSIGAMYQDKPAVQAVDVAFISMHAVKNITTAEGGLICLNLPKPFDNEEIYHWLKLNSLNGQTKGALDKLENSGWRYDIVTDGLKVNMTDLSAAIGLTQLGKYRSKLLPGRRRVYDHYTSFFNSKEWAKVPVAVNEERTSSFHLYPLRINNITEQQRDVIIQKLMDAGVMVNVHFVPLPMHTLFKNMGYKIEDYPVAYADYACEISLPIYPQLMDEDCAYVEEQVEKAYIAAVS